MRSLRFGIIDREARSIALCRAGRLIGYGKSVAATRLAVAYQRWSELGMPGAAAYRLEVRQAADVSITRSDALTEHRGDSVLIRTLDSQAGVWRSLLDRFDETDGGRDNAER